MSLNRLSLWIVFVLVLLTAHSRNTAADEQRVLPVTDASFQKSVAPLLQTYCQDCHRPDLAEADVDLTNLNSLEDLRDKIDTWVRVRAMLDSHQMPPNDAPQPNDVERETLQNWVRRFLTQEARAMAGDPGPVVLRRLSNAEYTYTIQDLTGVADLNPAAEFPVDGAAGEGFTNVGSGLVMSPQLVRKYLDAAKQVSQHAALVPTGIRFSPYTSQRDLTDDLLAKIQAFYAQYTTTGSGTEVNLQGIRFETNQGGVLPIADYLTATVVERNALLSGQKTLEQVAADRQLSPVYLKRLWRVLMSNDRQLGFLLQQVRTRWENLTPDEVPQLVTFIEQWQPELWKFNVVGHVGREGAPASWLEAVTPVVERREFRVPLPATSEGRDVVVRLIAGDADGEREHDFVKWQNARIERTGQPPVPLRDVQNLHQQTLLVRKQFLEQLPAYLKAVAELESGKPLLQVAKEADLPASLLTAAANFIGVSAGGPVKVQGHFTQKLSPGEYDFITGWGFPQTPSIMANFSDKEVRIPGVARPHSLLLHPSVTNFVALGWQSPISGRVQIKATVADAHDTCGNGFEWWAEHRYGTASQFLINTAVASGGEAELPATTLTVAPGELLSVIIGPGQNDHVCDLTDVRFTITELDGARREWDASAEVSPNLLAANPHADRHGHDGIWHFYEGPLTSLPGSGDSPATVPTGSLLTRWRDEVSDRDVLVEQLMALVEGAPPADDQTSSPDGQLYGILHTFPIPHDAVSLENTTPDPRFGTHPRGAAIDSHDLVVQAPASLEFLIPAAFADGELVVTGTFDGHSGIAGIAGITQLHVTAEVVATDSQTPASSADTPVASVPSTSPLICAPDEAARQKLNAALAEFRELFPLALCYTRIVPVDEAVTATLFHREDELFQQLMLDDAQTAELNRLWDELLYVSEEPLKMVVSLEQIREFATQDRPDAVGPWDRMKPAVQARADAFREQMKAIEPIHVSAVVKLADRAWRRPLKQDEQRALHKLYQTFRDESIPHTEAIRLLIARVLTSPDFLYRREFPAIGSQPTEVTDPELASRLSYFLWSTLPDAELRQLADANQLTASPDNQHLLQQTRRLLKDQRTRRLAIHFACQWLHVRDFDQNNDKNEALYPEFADLRGAMYEETVRFFEDMFRNNGSLLDLLNADHTFLNAALAKHYGVEGVNGTGWQRVTNVSPQGRGGILAMATVLASQSGASRTSPILRGNWVSETLLGERLPRPPPGIPQLPDAVPAGLTARQLIERHSSDAACAKCHERIDPYGFALEQYDALGRLRPTAVDTKTTLFEGLSIDGLDGLRNYLLTDRRDDVLRQFCRKLLGYALAREVRLSDEPLLDDMLTQLSAHDYRFHTAVETIVQSSQFRRIRPKVVAE